MSYLNRLPITSPVFWDLTVAVSQLSPLEQEALLATLQFWQHLKTVDPTWRAAHKLTLVPRPEEQA